jgi:superfamily II DNA helicase RecQ
VLVLGDASRPSRCIAELDGSAPHEPVPSPRAARAAQEVAPRPKRVDDRSSVAAEVGLRLKVLGGYEGTIAEIGAATVRLAVDGGGTFAVRYGERVQVDGVPRTLGPPASPHADAAAAALKAWRAARSKADGVPAYVVLSDKHLAGIAERHPANLNALRGCPGIGPAKLEAYGEDILEVLAGVAGDEVGAGG